MNDELKTIFDKLPEGIILFDIETKKVSLTNLEFKRLFQCQGEIEDEIQYVQLKKYQASAEDDKQANMTPEGLTLDLFQASQLNDSDTYYEVLLNNQQDNQIQCLQKNHNKTNSGDNTQHQISSGLNEIVSLQQCKIFFQGEEKQMILLKNLTPLIKYEKLKVENHYYEMLTATVSHDMRTPLNAIIGLLGNLENFVHQQGKRYLPIIQSSSKFMLFLVNDLLDFFQIKNGKFKKNEGLTNLRDGIRELVDMFKVAANEKGIQLIFFCQDDFPDQVIVDSQRIQQILLNLLQNALKFTFEGSITVTMRYEIKSQLIVFNVQDSGIGIKDEDREKLFTMFGKIEATRNINTSGVGIGLTICKKIVEAFGGYIYLEDQDPRRQGSTFTFSIKSYNQIVRFQSKKQSKVDLQLNLSKIRNQCGDGQTPSSIPTHRSNHQFLFEESKSDENEDIHIYTDQQNQLDRISFQNEERNSLFFQDIDLDSLQYETNHQDANFLNSCKFKSKFNISQIQECIHCKSAPNILIVDDNIFNVVTLQTIIESLFDVTIDKAMNGLEAVNKVKTKMQNIQACRFCNEIKQRNYKIIFMDANMPIMDGLQASQEIRLLEQIYQQDDQILESSHFSSANKFDIHNQRSLIIGLTAYDSDHFKQKCIDSGMDRFMTKPITATTIRLIMEDQI
eukprot:403364475